MSKADALALYRREKAAALGRGVDLRTPQPIPERHHSRHRAWQMQDGHATVRDDVFVVSKSSPR